MDKRAQLVFKMCRRMGYKQEDIDEIVQIEALKRLENPAVATRSLRRAIADIYRDEIKADSRAGKQRRPNLWDDLSKAKEPVAKNEAPRIEARIDLGLRKYRREEQQNKVHRALFLLHTVWGFSAKELGAVFNMKENSIWTLLSTFDRSTLE